MEGIILAVAILFPLCAGFICWRLKNYKIRGSVITLTAVILIALSIVFFLHGDFEYTPAATWDTAIIALDYILLAYFLYVGIRDLVTVKFSIRSIFTIGLVLLQGIPLALFEFSWAPGIEAEPTFLIDHLALIMCLIICIIGSLICVYGIRYMKDHEEHLKLKASKQPRFFFYMIMFLGAMNGLVFANNLLWLFFFWEVTTLCCYALIRHDETEEAIESGFRALWMCLIGGVGFVFAIILVFNRFDTISLKEIIDIGVGVQPLLLLPLAFLCLAAFTKAAQLPFQSWLLGAMVAPTPVSALLHSSTMVKAGVYLVIRLAPAFQGTYLSTIIAIFGAFVFLTTSILAISQNEGKRVLAYSTIGNLGLIMLCAGINTPLAMAAAIMLIMFHAISKGLLFLCAGTIEHHIWSRNIEDMEGLVGRLPLLTAITIAGMISMLVAPFGVLVSKWAAIQAAPETSPLVWSTLVLIMLVAGSGATTVFWVKWMGRLLGQVPTPQSPKMEPFIPLYHGILLLFIVVAFAASCLIAPVYNQVVAPALAAAGYAAAFSTADWFLRSTVGIFAAWPLLIVAAAALVIPLLLVRMKREEVRPAYMCGENVEYETAEFRSLADERTGLETGGFYLGGILGERNLNRFVNPIALLILLILFALVGA